MAGARREAVALREVRRGRHGAGHLVEPSGAGLDGGDGTEQAAGVLVAGVGEDLLGGALLDDLASVHDGDGVCHLGHEGEVVGDEDHREAELLAQLVEQVDDLLLHGHVEGGGGLVGDDQLRVAGQGHGDEHALALAAGQLVRVGLQRALRIEAHELEQFLGAAGAAAGGELLHLRLDEHGRVERGESVLIDHGDLVAA